MLIGCPSTSEAARRKAEDDHENRLTPLFHQFLIDDFRFMQAARLQSGEYADANVDPIDIKDIERFRHHLQYNRDGLVTLPLYNQGDEKYEVKGVGDERAHRFMARMSSRPTLDVWAHWVLGTKAFSGIMMAIIVLSSVLMCIEGETIAILDEEGNRNLRTFMETTDFFFLVMFAAEILLKWLDDFWGFWRDYWNCFDFIVTLMLLMPPLLDDIIFLEKEDEEWESVMVILRYFRIARIVRTLNAVTRIRKIWLIWHAITRTFPALVFITLLMAIFFYIYAIIGIQIFEEYSETHISPLTLKYTERFTTLPYALLTLFQVFTLDKWFNIMEEIVEVQGYLGPVIYFLSWVLLGSIIFNNFFAGVMVNYFQNISKELEEQSVSAYQTTQLAMDLNQFAGDESTVVTADDPNNDWECKVLQNVDVLRITQNIRLSPTLWSRDTLFQYYIILEAVTSNLHERDQLLFLLNQALVTSYKL